MHIRIKQLIALSFLIFSTHSVFAYDYIGDYDEGKLRAESISTKTDAFDKILSSADDDVQKALETLEENAISVGNPIFGADPCGVFYANNSSILTATADTLCYDSVENQFKITGSSVFPALIITNTSNTPTGSTVVLATNIEPADGSAVDNNSAMGVFMALGSDGVDPNLGGGYAGFVAADDWDATQTPVNYFIWITPFGSHDVFEEGVSPFSILANANVYINNGVGNTVIGPSVLEDEKLSLEGNMRLGDGSTQSSYFIKSNDGINDHTIEIGQGVLSFESEYDLTDISVIGVNASLNAVSTSSTDPTPRFIGFALPSSAVTTNMNLWYAEGRGNDGTGSHIPGGNFGLTVASTWDSTETPTSFFVKLAQTGDHGSLSTALTIDGSNELRANFTNDVFVGRALLISGNSDFTIKFTNTCTAPSTTAGVLFTSRYGGNTKALGDPTVWFRVENGGNEYAIPAYQIA